MMMEGLNTALVVLSLGAALAYGLHYTVKPVGFLRSLAKTLAVSSLALIALFSGSTLLLVGALGLGAMGDFFLSREGDKAFLFGLSAFAIAHVFYVVLLVEIGGFADLLNPLVLALCVFSLGMASALFKSAGALRWPVVIYVAIIAAMGVAAIGLPSLRWVSLVAAVLFIVSDTVLAFELFLLPDNSKAKRFTPYVIWSTYYVAQLLFFWDLNGFFWNLYQT